MSHIAGIIGLSAADAITVHHALYREVLALLELTGPFVDSQVSARRDLAERIAEAVEDKTGVKLNELP